MGKKSRKKDKLAQEQQLSDQHNSLYWQLLDAVAADLPLPKYDMLKSKYEKAGALALWVSEDGDYKQIAFFQSTLASDDLHDKVLTNIADRAHKIIQNLTAVLNQQTDKIKIHNDILTFMEIYAKLHWYAIVKMWEKLDFYRKEMKTNTLRPDTIAPLYDFAILRQHLANLLGFVSVLKKATSNEITFYNKMMEDITDMMVHAGAYLQIDHPDLLSEQVLLSELRSYKDFLSKPIYYYVATSLYSNDINTLSIGKEYFWKYIDVLKADRDLDSLDCKSIGYCAYEITVRIYESIKNKIHPDNVSLAEGLLHYKEFQFYLENTLHYFERCNELDAETFKKYKLDVLVAFTKKRLSWAKDQIVKIKNAMVAEIKCDAVTVMKLSQENDSIEIIVDESKKDYVFALSNALCNAKVSASVDTSVKNKINIRDMMDTSIGKIEDVLKTWQQTLPKENENNSNNQKKPIEQPIYDVSRITEFEVVEEKLTNTQINKLKKSKNKELEEPSLKEQIKTEVAAKLKKPPKKIIFPGGEGQRNYIYDQSKETEDDCDVFRLHGQQCKRMYVRINDELYAYLLDQEPELLTMLKKLCKNGTVESDSRGHTCFILSGEEFAEYGQTGMLFFSKGNKLDAQGRVQVMEENANEAVHNNDNNNNFNVNEDNAVADELNNNNARPVGIPITRKNITFGKCKIWHEGGRLFGNTVAITPKPSKPKNHYHLIEINAVKIKHG